MLIAGALIWAVIVTDIPCGRVIDSSKGNVTDGETLTKESLKQFLANDSTEDQYYKYQVHDCIDFSIELAHNLTGAGYDAGVTEQYPIERRDVCGHVIVWVRFGNETTYVEPQSDQVYTPDEYTNLFDTKVFALADMPTMTMIIRRARYRAAYTVRMTCLKYLLVVGY